MEAALIHRMKETSAALGDVYAKHYNELVGAVRHEAVTKGYVQGVKNHQEPSPDPD